MIHGLDSGFLVAAEVAEHADHRAARQTLSTLVAAGDRIALAPQVLAECIHVVTDPRRFTEPLGMDEARGIAEQWWTASEVERVFANDTATQQFLSWLQQFSFGRKRLLDTRLAATYHQAGIHSILTTNASDFVIFGVFNCITRTMARRHPDRLLTISALQIKLRSPGAGHIASAAPGPADGHSLLA